MSETYVFTKVQLTHSTIDLSIKVLTVFLNLYYYVYRCYNWKILHLIKLTPLFNDLFILVFNVEISVKFNNRH